jgi:hypothetical protein
VEKGSTLFGTFFRGILLQRFLRNFRGKSVTPDQSNRFQSGTRGGGGSSDDEEEEEDVDSDAEFEEMLKVKADNTPSFSKSDKPKTKAKMKIGNKNKKKGKKGKKEAAEHQVADQINICYSGEPLWLSRRATSK